MLALIVLSPLTGFIFLSLTQRSLSKNLSAIVGVGSIGFSALVTLYIYLFAFNKAYYTQSIFLWRWLSLGNSNINFNLVLLDGLSLAMLSVTVFVGFLIHLFALWYMQEENEYSRFFAYTNLFVASMLVLILADNLLLMYLGWEGVGLCSYLLIGFYYKDSKNIKAASKAFVVSRIGDVLLILSLLILYKNLGTLSYQKIIELSPVRFKTTDNMLWWITLLILGGAVSKSAQIPLQTWLADAMVGPTPVSALIHATTMVTAGVYLIARTHQLFLMTPGILHFVGVVGATTLVVSSFSALVQTNIKRILAYSTMSQVGYMFLALGVQAWNAAVFHLITHAFCKALLFLSSGSIILSCNREQNIFKMGGLRKTIPFVYACFLVGSIALSAVPLITADYFSKNEILAGIIANDHKSFVIIFLFGSFMTSLYIFRVFFVVFYGKEREIFHIEKGVFHNLPLVVLMILSTFIGAIFTKPFWNIFPETVKSQAYNRIHLLEISTSFLVIAGILIARWLWFGKERSVITVIENSFPSRFLKNFWYHEWGFNWLYNIIFVKTFLGVMYLLRHDPLNMLLNIPGRFSYFTSRFLSFFENGQLQRYLISLSIGATLVLTLLMIFR